MRSAKGGGWSTSISRKIGATTSQSPLRASASLFWEAGGLDLKALPGKRVRVRGWIEWWNGPMIAVSNLEAIEVLAPTPAGG